MLDAPAMLDAWRFCAGGFELEAGEPAARAPPNPWVGSAAIPLDVMLGSEPRTRDAQQQMRVIAVARQRYDRTDRLLSRST